MPRRKNLSADERQRVQQLHDAGRTFDQIAAELKIHRTTVYRVLNPESAAKNRVAERARYKKRQRSLKQNTPVQRGRTAFQRAKSRLRRCQSLLEASERGEILTKKDARFMFLYTSGKGRTSRSEDWRTVLGDSEGGAAA